MNLMSSLNITAGALSVNEKAISVVSHNVANMNTEGYHKQRVNLQARNIAGQIGDNTAAQVRANGGVKIANVMRYNSDYLNNYYRSQVSQLNYLEQQLGNMDEIASIFDDLEGTGIDSALSNFYEALNNLNEYPASSAARVSFIETAQTLTSLMNSKSEQLDNLTGKALGDGEDEDALKNSKIYSECKSLNDALENLAAVNKALQTTQTGTLTANNLLDKRDVILNEIAEYVDITIDENQNGSVSIYTGNVALVRGAEVTGEVSVQTAKSYYGDDWKDKTTCPVVMTISGTNVNESVTGGALGGLLHSTDGADGSTIDAGSVQKSLNKLASAIADIFNDFNTRNNAYCINPNDTGLLKATDSSNTIFVSTDGKDINGGNITINSDLLTDTGMWNIACAYFENGEGYDQHAVGNAQNVIDMLSTRSQEQGALDGMSVEDYYSSLLGKIASAGSSAQNLYDTQNDVVDSLANQLDDEYGVDLNEELIDLVKYQTAYAAAAQVFNVVNSCLDVLMSLGT